MAENDLELGEKKSSKTLWIILSSVLAVIVLVIGTLYAMGMIHAPGFMSGNYESVDTTESEKGTDSIYYPLSSFTVNFRGGDGTRYLQVGITALVESESVVGAMEKHEPAIRNNLLLLLSAQDPSELRTREGKEALRKRVLQEIQTILNTRTGEKGIDEIFFTGFVCNKRWPETIYFPRMKSMPCCTGLTMER